MDSGKDQLLMGQLQWKRSAAHGRISCSGKGLLQMGKVRAAMGQVSCSGEVRAPMEKVACLAHENSDSKSATSFQGFRRQSSGDCLPRSCWEHRPGHTGRYTLHLHLCGRSQNSRNWAREPHSYGSPSRSMRSSLPSMPAIDALQFSHQWKNELTN